MLIVRLQLRLAESKRLLALSLLISIGHASKVSADDAIQYNRDIRPILAENCFACHGPDSAARKADLRVDQADAAIEQGAIVPGKPNESEAIRRMFSDNPEELMPPPDSHKKLTAAEKELLRHWIEAGAKYQPHWSFIAPQRSPLPEVKDQAWVRNAIDQFVLAKLEQMDLSPAPEADRRTLARRVSLDLTGLPPAPEAVQQFVVDPSSDAYEEFIEQLLASPRWGEHRARYWLDAARYADTHGIHMDNYREMWSYRDGVIGAFNRNLPFDQFTIEQLAGDLLPNSALDQRIASGFNRCNITTSEGGAIDEEYLVLYARDRTETTSTVWLGLTAGCAVCHDHKFDPLSQSEFYKLAAFFNNTTQAAMDGNIKDTPPVVAVPAAKDRERWEALPAELTEVTCKLEARKQAAKSEFDQWLADAAVPYLAGLDSQEQLELKIPLDDGQGNTVAAIVHDQPRKLPLVHHDRWTEGYVAAKAYHTSGDAGFTLPDVGDVEQNQPFSLSAWFKLPKEGAAGALLARMDEQHDYRGWDLHVETDVLSVHLVHKWPANAIKVVLKNPLSRDAWHHVVVTYNGSAKAAGVKIYVDGQLQQTNTAADSLENTIRTDVPLKIGQRHSQSPLSNVAVQDVRFYRRILDAAQVDDLRLATRAAWLVGKPRPSLSDAERSELFEGWLGNLDSEYRGLQARSTELQQEQVAIQGRGTIAHVMQERAVPPIAFVLKRGEYDKRQDQVSAETPTFLPAMPTELPKNRLGFARWLLTPQHPLTARVTVNRFWQEMFGMGLVRTAGDFGVSGELPANQQLLDWLAIEFRETGWDVKRFFKLVVMSATYRQAAVATPEKLEKDPHNRRLSRGPRFRMDAEMLRDGALAVSGLLVDKIGGPSVKPYQPGGVWEGVAIIGSNTRDYVPDKSDGLYRRSLYSFWKRAAPPASMEVFNAPTRETCVVRRERTNTPLQALVTLNDPQFVEAARRLAQAAIQAEENSDNRLNWLAMRLLARPWRPEELGVARSSLADLLEHYAARADEAQKLTTVGESAADAKIPPTILAAWTMLANELMNLDEVLNK